MRKESSLLHSTVFSSIGIYTEYVFGMVVSILIARHLQPAGFGSYSVIIWMVSLGVIFTNSGTATAAIRFVAELRGGEQTELIAPLLAYLRRAQVIFLGVVLLVGGLALLLAGHHVAPEMDHVWLFVFLVVTITVRAMYMFNIGVAKGFQNFRGTAVIAVASAPITLLMVAVATWFSAPVGVFLGIFVASSLLLWFMSHRQTAASIPASLPGAVLPPALLARVKRHMRLTALTVTLGFLAGSEIEVVFLKMYSSEDSAGQFKVAYQLAMGAALLVPGVFGAVLLPMMASALKQGAEVAAQRFVASTRYLALLAAPLVAFGVVFATAIVGVLYGTAYAPAAPVFAACLVGGSLLTITQGGSSLLISADRQGSILAMVSIMAVLKIALDAVLVIHYGLLGATVAYLVVSFLHMGVVMVLAIRASRAMPDWWLLGRITLAAAVGAAVAYPLLHHLAPLAAVIGGGLVVCACYLPLTLLFNCWSRGDIEHLRALHGRLGSRRIGLLDKVLERAHRRAHA